MNALASLTLLDNSIRTEVTDKLSMLPRISLCLSHPHAGTRLAACYCIRSLSRAVQVLRTAILDSGVSEILCKIVEDRDEDKRVTNIALAAMSNLVMNFSPLRKVNTSFPFFVAITLFLWIVSHHWLVIEHNGTKLIAAYCRAFPG